MGLRPLVRLLAAACAALAAAAASAPVEFVVSTVVKRAPGSPPAAGWVVTVLVRFQGFDEASMEDWRVRNALYLQLAGGSRLYTAAEVSYGDDFTEYAAAVTHPGAYTLTVTELFLKRRHGNPQDHRLVEEAEPDRSLSADWFRGHWDTTGDDYAYVPDDCAFDQWSPEELRVLTASPAVPRRWVLVLGSSKDRGVYSRLIDLVMRHEEKVKFHHSVVQKCWGWLDVRLGRLRLTFADFRSQFYFSSGITCHNEKVASSPQLHLDGVKFWKRLFAEERYQPDVIWLVGDRTPLFPLSNHGQYLAQARKAGWGGTLLYAPSSVMPNSFPSWLACAHNVSAYAAGLREEVRKLRAYHDRTLLVDLAPVLYSSVTDMEKHLDANCYSCSNHYHYICDRHDRRICGRVVNTAAQVVYNVLYGPKAEALALAHSAVGEGVSMEQLLAAEAKDHALVCFDCPKDLVPIHITVKPNPACYWTPLKMQLGPVGPSFPPPKCPCLNESVVKTFTSHGGSVIDVRECDMASAGAAAKSLVE